MATNTPLNVPPYMPIGIFNSTNEKLAETMVPSGPLDRRVLDWLSGADYGSFISGMRFLGLVDGERKATQKYRDLIAALKKDRNSYVELLMEIAWNAYMPILQQFDWEAGTASELEKLFKDVGVSQGQMLTKTVRFAVKLWQEMGVPVSPHITKPKAPRAASPKKNGNEPRPRRGNKPDVPPPPRDDVAATGYERLPIPGMGANAYIQYPKDLSESDVAMFEAMLTPLRTYAKGRTGKKDKS